MVSFLPDHCAFGDQRAADASGNRRGDSGVAKVQPGAFDRRLAGGHVGGGLPGVGPGIVVVLAADGLVVDQLGVALLLQFRLERVGLGLAQYRLGAIEIRLERCRIDPEQHLALFHVAALAKGPLQHHAGDAGTHLGHARRGNAPGQFAADRQRSGFDGFDANAGQWRLFFGDRSLVARAQRQRQCNQAEPGKQFL